MNLLYLRNAGLTLILCCLSAFSVSAQPAKSPDTGPNSVYHLMKKVADWQWNELETKGWKTSKKDWTNGALYTGMMAWGNVANDERYYKKLIQVGEDNNWKIGKNRHEADDYCVGQLYSQLYGIYKNPKYIADFKSLADTLVMLPHTESLEWKNRIDYREWAWCDALFMGPPALADLAAATGDQKYLDKTAKLWWKTTDYLMDKDEFLYYRDSRFFSKKENNGAKVFWSRGNGWVIGGLVRVLSVMPDDYPDRPRFVKLLQNMSAKMAKIQQADGTWHASLLDPDAYPVKETSGTGFYCYAMAWGINNGVLSYKEYAPVVHKAWEAMVSSVHPDGKLGFVQAQGAAPDKVTYDDTDVYGVGAFLLAGTEIMRMKVNEQRNLGLIEYTNPSAVVKAGELQIKWAEVLKAYKGAKAGKLKLRDALSGEEIPVKVKMGKDKKPAFLSFNSVIQPGSNKLFTISNI